MARQSATNPRFRCNVCKDYYSAPEHNVHYQCASHGYLCEKHLVKDGDKLNEDYDYDENDNQVYSYIAIPKKYKGKCAFVIKGSFYDSLSYLSDNPIEENICLNTPVRFNWHKDVGRWIEEGREEEEKAKLKPKAKSKTKPDYLKEINVLLDLLEDDTLTKEVFIKKMREKIK